jgi:hypothetical protein
MIRGTGNALAGPSVIAGRGCAQPKPPTTPGTPSRRQARMVSERPPVLHPPCAGRGALCPRRQAPRLAEHACGRDQTPMANAATQESSRASYKILAMTASPRRAEIAVPQVPQFGTAAGTNFTDASWKGRAGDRTLLHCMRPSGPRSVAPRGAIFRLRAPLDSPARGCLLRPRL